MSDEFESAAEHLTSISSSLKDSDLLYLYARYKFSTVGHCNTEKPSIFDIKGRKKWYAWKEISNLTQEEAMKQYVEKIKLIDPKFSFSDKPNRIQLGIAISTLNKPDEPQIEDCNKSLFDWCKEGNLQEIENSYQNQLEDEEGRTLLHWACDRSHVDIVNYLINHNHQVNCVDKELLTPLHYASSTGNMQIIKLLVSKGADVTLKDVDGESSIDCAENKNIREYLLNIT